MSSKSGMEQLRQWLGRVLHDDAQVYSSEELAAAFEIAVCESLACAWPQLEAASPALAVVSGPASRLVIYRCLLLQELSWPRRSGFLQALVRDYPRHGAWLAERGRSYLQDGETRREDLWHALLEPFLSTLDGAVPLDPPGATDAGLAARVKELDALVEGLRRDKAALEEDLDFAEDRAARAHRRLREADAEAAQLRRQLRDADAAADKLRCERRVRIRSERESGEAQRNLAHLRREYVKLDQRLQQMASRLSKAESRNTGICPVVEIRDLRTLAAEQLLGLSGKKTSAGEVSQLRRRFAAVFHPDRVKQLPSWAQVLCEEILGAVNEACDRAAK